MEKCDHIGLEIKNDLMSPIYEIGDIIILDKTKIIKNGKYGGFILNGRAYICKYKEKRGKKYLLFEKNREKIKIKSTDSFKKLGGVKFRLFNLEN